jgi:hypothetical protein
MFFVRKYSFPENALYGLPKPDSQTGSFSKDTFPVEVIDVKINI